MSVKPGHLFPWRFSLWKTCSTCNFIILWVRVHLSYLLFLLTKVISLACLLWIWLPSSCVAMSVKNNDATRPSFFPSVVFIFAPISWIRESRLGGMSLCLLTCSFCLARQHGVRYEVGVFSGCQTFLRITFQTCSNDQNFV